MKERDETRKKRDIEETKKELRNPASEKKVVHEKCKKLRSILTSQLRRNTISKKGFVV